MLPRVFRFALRQANPPNGKHVLQEPGHLHEGNGSMICVMIYDCPRMYDVHTLLYLFQKQCRFECFSNADLQVISKHKMAPLRFTRHFSTAVLAIPREVNRIVFQPTILDNDELTEIPSQRYESRVDDFSELPVWWDM